MAYIAQFIYSKHWGMKPIWSKLSSRLQHAVVGEDFYKLIWKKTLFRITSYYSYTIINFEFQIKKKNLNLLLLFFWVNTK